ncbi:MAG: hypothetical protein IPJ65_23055 [Archangiaceae bacterium]|nr:hypothetical protein [Archangiaceae bacterium]
MLTLLLFGALSLRYDAAATASVSGGTLAAGRTGNFEVLTPAARIGFTDGPFLSVALPIARVEVSAQPQAGLGDLFTEAGWQTGDFTYALASMWPTGDGPHGFGTAHIMLAPTVAARHLEDGLLFSASVMLRGAIPLGMHGQHHHQSIIAPHDLLDLPLTASLGRQLGSWLTLELLAAPVIVLIPHPSAPVGTRFSIGGAASARAGRFRFGLQAMVPVTQNRTSSWALSTTVAIGDVPPEACH